MGTAQAFWSYVHEDNDAMHGAIRRLAQHVQDEYAVLTGGPELGPIPGQRQDQVGRQVAFPDQRGPGTNDVLYPDSHSKVLRQQGMPQRAL